jgi:chromosome partitioning protein
MLVLADVNMKGGVGKTTVTVGLAVGFALKGMRVLVVDLDSQAHASTWLEPQGETPLSAYHVLTTGKVPRTPALSARHPHLSVLPATEELINADIALSTGVGKETYLRRGLDGLAGQYDVVLIDCPPNMGKSVISALVAAHAVLAPVTPTAMSLSGLQRLDEALTATRECFSSRAQLLGYVLFASDSREVSTRDTRDILGGSGKLFKTEIRTSAAAKTLHATRLTAWDPKADTRGAEDYPALLEEVVERVQQLSNQAA